MQRELWDADRHRGQPLRPGNARHPRRRLTAVRSNAARNCGWCGGSLAGSRCAARPAWPACRRRGSVSFGGVTCSRPRSACSSCRRATRAADPRGPRQPPRGAGVRRDRTRLGLSTLPAAGQRQGRRPSRRAVGLEAPARGGAPPHAALRLAAIPAGWARLVVRALPLAPRASRRFRAGSRARAATPAPRPPWRGRSPSRPTGLGESADLVEAGSPGRRRLRPAPGGDADVGSADRTWRPTPTRRVRGRLRRLLPRPASGPSCSAPPREHRHPFGRLHRPRASARCRPRSTRAWRSPSVWTSGPQRRLVDDHARAAPRSASPARRSRSSRAPGPPSNSGSSGATRSRRSLLRDEALELIPR